MLRLKNPKFSIFSFSVRKWFTIITINLRIFKKKLFQKILIENAKQLLIKSISAIVQKPFIKQTEHILDLNTTLGTITESVLSLIQADLDVTKITNKLKKWYELEANEFLSEIGKQNKNFSINQKSQWLKYFATEKLKALDLDKQIEATDKEIDKMAYKL